ANGAAPVSRFFGPAERVSGRKHAGSLRRRFRSAGLTLLALTLTACGGQADHYEPEPVMSWDAAGLHVRHVHGAAEVRQRVPMVPLAGFELQSDGFLFVEYDREPWAESETVVAVVQVELTGADTIVVRVDGELLVPESAWVDVE